MDGLDRFENVHEMNILDAKILNLGDLLNLYAPSSFDLLKVTITVHFAGVFSLLRLQQSIIKIEKKLNH